MKNFSLLNMGRYFSLLLAGFVVIFPPYIIFINAFKGTEELYARTTMALPDSFLFLDNFIHVFFRANIGLAFWNTLIITFFSVAGSIILGSMFCYAVARIPFRFSNIVIALFLLATIIPGITTQVVNFKTIQALGFYNTMYAPITLYIGADILMIYIYLQFIRNIPFELDENAMIEGASLFRIYYRIIFPLMAPATATIAILKTINIYNDMFTPFLYMPKDSLVVVSTSLMRFFSVQSAEWQYISAAIIMIMIPTAVLYLFLQRFIFSGITSGAIK